MRKEVLDIDWPGAASVVLVVRDVQNRLCLRAQDRECAFERTPPENKKAQQTDTKNREGTCQSSTPASRAWLVSVTVRWTEECNMDAVWTGALVKRDYNETALGRCSRCPQPRRTENKSKTAARMLYTCVSSSS